MAEERRPLRERVWARLFGDRSRRPMRMEKVISYITYRLDDGARLEEVVQEEYVRRQTSSDEIARVLEDPRIVEAARRRMHREFGSEEMSPGKRATRSSG